MLAGGEGSQSRRARLLIDAAPPSVAQARTFVSDMVRIWGCDDPMQIAALLTSEVVTNAVRHAAETVCVAVALDRDELLVVEASDDQTGGPEVIRPDPDAEGGRGMFLVDQLARRWGVQPTGAGKIVWFEVPVACPANERESG